MVMAQKSQSKSRKWSRGNESENRIQSKSTDLKKKEKTKKKKFLRVAVDRRRGSRPKWKVDEKKTEPKMISRKKKEMKK